MASISQNPSPHVLPDWRNLGVLLRILLGANGLALFAALAQAEGFRHWIQRYAEFAAWLEAPLLLAIVLLALMRNMLWRLPPWPGRVGVLTIAGVAAWLQYLLWDWLALATGVSWQAVSLGVSVAALLLYYLELRARAYSPAVAEARLMALNARIRPHFLFNSINAVLALIRAEPRQAEAALENISDLFRAALRDPSDWLPLSDEIALCRQYLELEKLRLGERLRVRWDIREVPLDARIPPLMLQPLVENAVYHGIEPAAEGGEIQIVFARSRDEILIEISNPTCGGQRHTPGNQMALGNIRERLALYFDLEARLEIEEHDGFYRVSIRLPCRTNLSAS